MKKSLHENAIHDYLATLKSLFEVTPSDTGYLLVTPFQRPDGDYIQIELIVESGDNITISDNGDSVNFLFSSGLDTEDPEIENMLSLIALQNGVKFINSEIFLTTSQDKIGRTLYSLLNAIIAASHLAYRKRLVEVAE